MELDGYTFHLRARNLSPATIKATKEYLRPFLAVHDPLSASRRDIEHYLSELQLRCQPSTVWTAWRHLRGFFAWLSEEQDIDHNPMDRIPRPIVPPVEIRTLQPAEVVGLLAACEGRAPQDRRDRAVIALLLDTGLRLSEAVNLSLDDVGTDFTIRVYGKGRKWRTVALGPTAQMAIRRWIRTRGSAAGPLWTGRRGALGPTGMRKMIQRRGAAAGIRLHPHMLRHTFVDSWIRNGGSEIDLARIAGWTSTRMTERYAQHRAEQRALEAHSRLQPLDSSLNRAR